MIHERLDEYVHLLVSQDDMLPCRYIEALEMDHRNEVITTNSFNTEILVCLKGLKSDIHPISNIEFTL